MSDRTGYVSDPDTLLIYLKGCLSRVDSDGMIEVSMDYITDAISIISALNPDILRGMREALQPFAERADRYDGTPGLHVIGGSCELWQLQNNKGMQVDISVQNLRDAREALRSLSPKDPSNGK